MHALDASYCRQHQVPSFCCHRALSSTSSDLSLDSRLSPPLCGPTERPQQKASANLHHHCQAPSQTQPFRLPSCLLLGNNPRQQFRGSRICSGLSRVIHLGFTWVDWALSPHRWSSGGYDPVRTHVVNGNLVRPSAKHNGSGLSRRLAQASVWGSMNATGPNHSQQPSLLSVWRMYDS